MQVPAVRIPDAEIDRIVAEDVPYFDLSFTWGCLLHLQAVLHLRYMQLLQAFWMG